MVAKEQNGWTEWSRHVLVELERLDKHCTTIASDLTSIKVEIAQLKVKSGLWGALGASVPIAIAILIFITQKYIIGG